MRTSTQKVYDSGSDDNSVPPLLCRRPDESDDDSSDSSDDDVSTESDSDDEFSFQDDASAFEISCEGEEVWSTINSVNVLPATEVTSNEIFELYDSDCCTATDVNHVDTDKEPIVRGQIGIGCSASCTGNREMLHDYAEFSPAHPCPIRLSPATEGSDALPKVWGYLKVPAHIFLL